MIIKNKLALFNLIGLGSMFVLPGSFIAAISIMSFACMGTACAVSMDPVTKNPKKTIPLASISITAIVGIVEVIAATNEE